MMFFSFVLAAALTPSSLSLATDGRTDYALVTEADASAEVRYVAQDLANVLKTMTGATFPVLRTDAVSGAGVRRIEVGTRRARSLVGEGRVAALAFNGSIAKSVGSDIALVGPDDYGTIGAVYDFLQKQLGCRWWTPMDAAVPCKRTLSVAPFETKVETPFECRWLITYQNITDALRDGSLFLLRNGLNANGERIFPNVTLPPGATCVRPQYAPTTQLVHTFLLFMPPHDERHYFERHPEWYAYLKSEKRRVDNRQLCFSNPGLRAEFTKNFLAAIEQKGGAGVYSITQEDYVGPFCDCDDCAKLIAKYDSPGGPYYDFILEIAPVVKARFPEALIDMIAYHHEQTQRAPRNCPGFPDNVVLTFAPIDDDFSKPMDHPNNAATLRDLEDWQKLVRRIWTWYYPLPYPVVAGAPYSGVRRGAHDLRLMLARGMNGVKYEHDVARDCGANFYDLQTWVLGRLFREPSCDVEALVKEFCEGYYGPASHEVWQVWDAMERAVANLKEFEGFSTAPLSAYTPEALFAWTVLFDAAEAKAAGDSTLLQRIREARIGTDMQLLARYARLSSAGLGGLPSPDAIYARLAETCRKAFVRRGFLTPARWTGHRAKTLRDIEDLHLVAAAKNLRPTELSQVPDDLLSYVMPNCRGSGQKRVNDEAAVFGYAAEVTGDLQTGKSTFAVMVHDSSAKKMLLNRTLAPSEMKAGAYTLYRIGTFTATGDATIILGHNWRAQAPIGEFYVAGAKTDYELWVSLRFEGPQYFAGATGETSVRFDRAILVRQGARKDDGSGVLHSQKTHGTMTKVETLPVACRAVETVKGEAPSLLPNGREFRLVWNDEFIGTNLDETKWNYRTNFWGSRFAAFAGPEDGCVEVRDGKVHLKVKKLANGQFVSPQLQTGELMWDIPHIENPSGFWPLGKRQPAKFLHAFGYYEARVRLQRKPGWWSAFWMQSETQGVCIDPHRAGIEHDIMESFSPGCVSRHMYHMNGYGPDRISFCSPRNGGKPPFYSLDMSTDEFHTFGLLWEPDGYTVFVDGRQDGEKVGSGPKEAVSQVPEFILISTECQWYRRNRMTGPAVPELEEAARAGDDFVVDFVRVYDCMNRKAGK